MFTSAQIRSKDTFKYSKIEFRAALPVGKWLRPSINLIGSSNAELEVMSNLQTGTLFNTYRFELDQKVYQDTNLHDPYANLNNFHIYTIQWNDSWVIISFDNKQVYLKLDIRKLVKGKGTPLNQNFTIMLNLEVGGNYWTDQLNNDVNYDKDASNWTCSLFIIDYIRVFKWNYPIANRTFKQDFIMVNSSDICGLIMPNIRNVYLEYKMMSKMSLSIIIAIVSVIVIIGFLAILNFRIFAKRKEIEKFLSHPKVENQYSNKTDDDDFINNNYEDVL